MEDNARAHTLPLPLVLLAAFAHPDRVVRRRLSERLDHVIEAKRPLYPEHRLRHFLSRTIGDPRDPAGPAPIVHDIAVRVFRLLFGRDDTRPWRLWLRLEGLGLPAHKDGLYVDRWLKLLPIKGARYSSGHRCPLLPPCRLVVKKLVERLQQLEDPPQSLQAICRFDGNYCLNVRGVLPFAPHPGFTRVCVLASNRPLDLALTYNHSRKWLTLETTSPEGLIVLSACLARKEPILLRDSRNDARGWWLVIGLHDFDGPETELPVLAGPPRPETWLTLQYPVELPARERVAVLRWRLPGSDWLPDNLLEKLP
jgi:hypothetical protein